MRYSIFVNKSQKLLADKDKKVLSFPSLDAATKFLADNRFENTAVAGILRGAYVCEFNPFNFHVQKFGHKEVN